MYPLGSSPKANVYPQHPPKTTEKKSKGLDLTDMSGNSLSPARVNYFLQQSNPVSTKAGTTHNTPERQLPPPQNLFNTTTTKRDR